MNQLQKENSLYLRQHADNPVNWLPWSQDAFKKAEEADKPVIISIGYSACHWCHVMAHESFEDPYIAGLMNEHFVCIKVDREERPDVDRIYMDAVQMLNGQGGWPLNVFCLPDGRPFAGGTYFPPDESRGYQMVTWPQLLMRISDFYQRQKSDLIENAEAIIGNLRSSNSPLYASGDPVSNEAFFSALGTILDRHDPEFGGFGEAPKFPQPMAIDFLLSMRATATMEHMNPDLSAQIDSAVNRTLTGMAHGGIYDQIGGGFCRYSVDKHWLIPHFEKMLYDNALLIDLYSRAYQRYPKPLYEAIVKETIEWLDREMLSTSGSYYSTLDADSEGEEGKFYVWNPSEIASVLGEKAGSEFCKSYGITSEGNFESSGYSNPTLLEPEFSDRESWDPFRQQLLARRQERVRPGRDEKLLTGWNALAIRGLSRAAMTFNNEEWYNKAILIADWIWNEMRDTSNKLSLLAYESGNNSLIQKEMGLLEDYAHTAEAFLALSTTAVMFGNEGDAWIEKAHTLAAYVLEHFKDDAAAGYFHTAKNHEALAHRGKDWFDNAIPSGNAALVSVFSQLATLTGEAKWAEELTKMKVAYAGLVERAPASITHALSGLVQNATGVAVVKYDDIEKASSLAELLVRKPWRPVLFAKDSKLSDKLQLCVGTQCTAPETDSAKVAEML